MFLSFYTAYYEVACSLYCNLMYNKTVSPSFAWYWKLRYDLTETRKHFKRHPSNTHSYTTMHTHTRIHTDNLTEKQTIIEW